MRFLPLNKRVLVVPVDDEVKDTDLIIPETQKEPPKKGRVEEVSPDVTLVSKGDLVEYMGYCGELRIVDGVECFILLQEDILGKWEA